MGLGAKCTRMCAEICATFLPQYAIMVIRKRCTYSNGSPLFMVTLSNQQPLLWRAAVAFLMFKFIYQVNHLYDRTNPRYDHSGDLQDHFQHLKVISSPVFSHRQHLRIAGSSVCKYVRETNRYRLNTPFHLLQQCLGRRATKLYR